MGIEAITESPTTDLFTPLARHQEQTPDTFFDSQPVLYLHSKGAQVLVTKSQFDENQVLQGLKPTAESESTSESSGANGTSDDELLIPNVDIWVTSRNLILFSGPARKGVSITYPAIALHALGSSESALLPESSQVVLLQLNLHDEDLTNSDDDIQTLDLTLSPSSIEDTSPTEVSEPSSEQPSPVKALFDALSACADLHPDPASPGSEEGEEDAQPGTEGWITAENMADFIDADGNFTGFAGNLGPGAGAVHEREEESVNGTGEDEEDSKWQRTG